MRPLPLLIAFCLPVLTASAADQPAPVAEPVATPAARPATADEVTLLRDAMRNSAQASERWAYTETRHNEVSRGKPRGDTIIRFDPSKPYAEQFQPIKINGKPPTEKQLKEYRQRGEKRGERIAREAEAARQENAKVAVPSLKIGGAKVQVDLDHPQVLQEAADHLTFLVPLHGKQSGIPMGNFQLTLQVARSSRLIESVRLRLLESFRFKLVAKLKAGEVQLNLAVVDPRYGPVMTRLAGDFDFSLLLMSASGKFEQIRNEWQRVKPYDERFEVKLGPMQLLSN